MSQKIIKTVIPVIVEIETLNLRKPFVYYAREDLQYNLDAFLLSTGLSLDCPKCRPAAELEYHFKNW